MAQEREGEALRAIAEAKWGVMSSGATDAPTGHFTVVEIPEHDGERKMMREAVFEDGSESFDNLEAGWYFVIQYSPDRLTYDKCKNRHYALARFTLARAAYVDWLES